MFQHLGRFAAKQSWAVCLLWLTLGVVLSLAAPTWEALTEDDDVRFVPERFTSVRAYQLIEKAFPQDVCASRLVYAVEREDGPLTDADFAVLDRVLHALERLRQDAPELKFGTIDSYQD